MGEGEVGKIYVTIGAKIDDLKKALDDAKKELGGVAGEADKTEAATGSLWKQFAAGQIAVIATTAVVGKLTSFLSGAIDASAEAERAQRGLDAAIEITRGNIPGLSDSLQDFAAKLQASTTFEDDAIIATEGLLVQLTDLDEKGLKEATKGAIGLASVMGMDLQSAARLVAMAMEGNYDRLTRYIPALREAKTEAEKKTLVMEKLGQMYQRAEADTGTYTGKMEQLKNAFGDMKETIGDFITQNETLRTGIGLAQGVVEAFTNGLRYMATHGMDYSVAQQAAIEKVLAFKDSLQVLKPSMDEMREAIEGGREKWEAYRERVGAMDKALADNKDRIVDWMQKGFEKIGLLDQMSGANDDLGASYAALGLKARDVAEKDFGKMVEAFEKLDASGLVSHETLAQSARKIVELADTYNFKLDPAIRNISQTTLADQKKAAEDAGKKLDELTKSSLELADAEIRKLSPALQIVIGDLQFIGYTALGASRDFGDSWRQMGVDAASLDPEIKKTLNGVENNFKDTTTNVSSRWDDMMRDITQGWADAIEKLIDGTSSFKDFMTDTWEAIKSTFFRVIADMIAQWITGFIKDLISGATSGGKEVGDALGGAGKAVEGLGGIVSGIGGSIGSILTGIATSLGAVITTLAASIGTAIVAIAEGIAAAATALAAAAPALLTVGAIAVAIYAGFEAVKALLGSGGGGGSGDGMGRVVERQDRFLAGWDGWHVDVVNILAYMQGMIEMFLGALCDKMDVLNNQIAAMSGYELGGVAWTPQIATIGEKEPEIVMPLSDYQSGTGLAAAMPAGASEGGGGGEVNITMNISAIDSQDVARFMAGKGKDALLDVIKSNTGGFTRELAAAAENY